MRALRTGEVRAFLDAHKEGAYELVDVRQPQEYVQGHIPGARFIPLSTLENVFDDPDSPLAAAPPEKPMLFYCAHGPRAQAAARLAEEHGHPAAWYDGGMAAWTGMAVMDAPRLAAFAGVHDLTTMLMRALDLEKAAFVLYDEVRIQAERRGNARLRTLMDEIADMELAHAKTVYRMLARRLPGHTTGEPPPFEALWEQAGGELMEGGRSAAELKPWVEDALGGEDGRLEAAELGLEIEYAAHDLYKAAAQALERGPDAGESPTVTVPAGELDDAVATFNRLAEQEKQHGRLLMRTLEAFADA